MEIKNRILDSLFDDINRELNLDSFLATTSFKRSMVQMKIYEVYCEVFEEVESDSNIIMAGIDSLYRIDALKILLDRLYSANKRNFFLVLARILYTYELWSKSKIHIKEIMLDLELLPEFDKEKELFKYIGVMNKQDNYIEENKNNEQEISIDNIQRLSEKYKELRDRKGDCINLKDTIDSYHMWYSSSIILFSRNFDNENPDYKYFKSVDNSGNGYTLSSNFKKIQGVYSILCDRIRIKTEKSKSAIEMNNKKIFVVHGHDSTMKLEVESFLKQLELEPIILNNQANNGNTIIEKLERNSNVGFAIILLSPCDEGRKKGSTDFHNRARQNVILELGYFIGHLGRDKVCTLKKLDVEEPSDFTGIAYTEYDNAGGWKLLLARELKSVGYIINVNSLLL